MQNTFGARLAASFAAGHRLCAGIDPHDALLDTWGLPRTAQGAESLGREVVRQVAGQVACIKPQIAFFERFGSAGYQSLERVLDDARQAGITIIADVKRGDIGSTFAAYAEAWLSEGSPLEADAMTVHGYQGFQSLAGAFEYVRHSGKGLFVLAATSNPEAKQVQQARLDNDDTLAQHMIASAHEFNGSMDSSVGSIGVVLGATLNLGDFGIRDGVASDETILPILAPGFGFQGASVGDVGQLFGDLAAGVIVSESRSVLGGGKAELRSRIEQSNETIREAYA